MQGSLVHRQNGLAASTYEPPTMETVHVPGTTQATKTEYMPLRQMLAIAGGIIAVLVGMLQWGATSGVNALNVQLVAMRTENTALRDELKKVELRLENSTAQRDALRRSQDADHETVQKLELSVANSDQRIRQTVEAMIELKDAMKSIAKAQIDVRAAVERIEMEMGRSRGGAATEKRPR